MTTFLTPTELTTAILDYQLEQLASDDATINFAILAAIGEATSYLNGKYDCTAIFGAVGDRRNILVLEHCKSLAIWYLVRRSHADIYFDRVKEYYTNAVEWFRSVAGVGSSGRQIAPDLPLKQTGGVTQTKFRAGSRLKFTHDFQ